MRTHYVPERFEWMLLDPDGQKMESGLCTNGRFEIPLDPTLLNNHALYTLKLYHLPGENQ